MTADPATRGRWGLLAFAVPPPPAELRDRLEEFRERGEAHLVVLHAGEPSAAGPAYGDHDLVWIERFPLPLLFVFEGGLAGGWLPIALACDLRACDEASHIDTSGLSGSYARTRLGVLRSSDL